MPLSLDRGIRIAAPAALPPMLAGTVDHGIAYVPQDRDQWCWAACFAMIRSFLGVGGMSQHQIATAYFGAAACQDPASGDCNRAAYPDNAARYCGLTCITRQRPLLIDELRRAIAAGPVELYFEFDQGQSAASHVALLTALYADGTFRLLDPWRAFGVSNPTFAELESGYHSGSWTRTYMQFQRAQ
jgi:hypothetical protein